MRKYLFKNVINFLVLKIQKYSTMNPWTSTYGLARSLIALSLMITLVFTGYENLFPLVDGMQLKPVFLDLEKIGLFYLFKDNILIAHILSVSILIWVIIGFLPQLSCIFHWWVAFSFFTSTVIIEGGDQIAVIVTMLLVPVCITDRRINHWNNKIANKKRSKTILFVWSIYFIISLQVSVIYLHAAVGKLAVEEWVNGTALYYWVNHNVFGVPNTLKGDATKILSNTFFVVILTWGAILLEFLLAGWLIMKRNIWNWKFMFISAVLFHVLIGVVHGLLSFMITMSGVLVLYFFSKNKSILAQWR